MDRIAILVLVVIGAEIHRQLIFDERPAVVGVEVLGLIWSLKSKGKRVGGVHARVFVVKLHVAVEITGTRPGNDLHASKPDAAELRAVWIVVDSYFLNLVLWRNVAAAESVNDKSARTASCIRTAAGAGD